MQPNPSGTFILKAQKRSLVAVNIIAALIGIVLLYYWFYEGYSRNLTAFIILSGIVVFWMLADYIYWMHKGIREIRIGPDYFEVLRGKSMEYRRIDASQITDIYFENRMSRRTFQIFLGPVVKEIPGIFTFFPGPKIRITSDSFDNNDFDHACDLIEIMFKSQQQ